MPGSVRRRAHPFPIQCPPGPETQVTVKKPQALLLSLAVALALSACTGDKGEAPATDAPAAGTASADADGAKALTLDESKLPPVNRFQFADIDDSKNVCTDLNAYANGKWLAANPVPGDRTSWGVFEMLDERSVGVQHQLAE